jgi:lipoprotein-anchoring transpeptidase ErfK/SrfK
MKASLLLTVTLMTLPAAYALPSGNDVLPNQTLHAAPDRDVYFDPNDLQDPQDPKRLYFDVVVVINKAVNAQTIDVYRFGKLVKHARVSTGRETPEYSNPLDPAAPTHDYFSQTYTGYFNVKSLDIDHHSSTWTDAFMPWAVFFDNGIATHRSPHEDLSQSLIDKRIGRRASGGCVRLHEQDAKDIFWWVRMSGGPFTQEELYRPHDPDEPDFTRESQEQLALGEQPYAKEQVVPIVNPDGSFKKDKNGWYITQWGYKTLYVVQNIPVGTASRAPRPPQNIVPRPQPPQNGIERFFSNLFGQ